MLHLMLSKAKAIHIEMTRVRTTEKEQWPSMSHKLYMQGHAVDDSSWLSAIHSWHGQSAHHRPSAGKHWLRSSMALHALLTKACLLMGCIANGWAVPPPCHTLG
jgi:hypothetical protein